MLLQANNKKLEVIERNINYFVQKKIDSFKDRLEKENMTLTHTNQQQEQVIKEHKVHINRLIAANNRI